MSSASPSTILVFAQRKKLTIVHTVVRFQHRHYVPIALLSGLVLPWLIAHLGWNDGLGGLIWGGAVARLLIW